MRWVTTSCRTCKAHRRKRHKSGLGEQHPPIVGQVAATAYGGPGGAAAYAAWYAYRATGGDAETALRVALITGATWRPLVYPRFGPQGPGVGSCKHSCNRVDKALGDKRFPGA
jgi:hypothetical protein